VNTSSGTGVEEWQAELLAALRRDVGEPEAPGEEAPPSEPERLEVLAFHLAGETYAVDIREVAEIVLPRDPTPLPRGPSFVLGVVTLRGTIVPVLDLALRLNLPPSRPSRASRIVVLRDGEERLGCWVDEVAGVVRFTEDEMEATGFASAVDPEFLRGIGYDRNGTLVAVLLGERLCDFQLEGG
jgi:purine-binding chemotaxis protein CheW